MNCRDEIRKVLQENPGVVFAYLFGSRARDTAGARSDWDIAVYFRDEAFKRNRWVRFYLEADVSKVLGDAVQVVALNNATSPLFLFQVLREGILLVDESPEERLLFERKAVRSFHDWRSYQNRRIERLEDSSVGSEGPERARRLHSRRQGLRSKELPAGR